MANHRRYDPVTGQYTTGHAWDGIEELYNPLPRWWVITLVLSFAVAIIYALLYPGWPTTRFYFHGLLGWTSAGQLQEEQDAARAAQAQWRQQIAAKSVAEIEQSDELRTFAITGGRALFNQNCAACHGQGAGGQQGQFPSLIDDDWLWGGKIDDVYQTIAHGIRNEDPESRQSEMPAFGEGMLTPEDISAVATYVTTLSDTNAEESRKAMPGAAVFENNCAACHGDKGQGTREMGAPRLADQIWLYGDSKEAIVHQVTKPRMGSMPSWKARLGDDAVKMLAVYVHSLGGGEK